MSRHRTAGDPSSAHDRRNRARRDPLCTDDGCLRAPALYALLERRRSLSDCAGVARRRLEDPRARPGLVKTSRGRALARLPLTSLDFRESSVRTVGAKVQQTRTEFLSNLLHRVSGVDEAVSVELVLPDLAFVVGGGLELRLQRAEGHARVRLKRQRGDG